MKNEIVKKITNKIVGINTGGVIECAKFFVQEVPEMAGNKQPVIGKLSAKFEIADNGPCATCGRQHDEGVGIGGYEGRWRSAPSGAKVCIYCYCYLDQMCSFPLSELTAASRGE